MATGDCVYTMATGDCVYTMSTGDCVYTMATGDCVYTMATVIVCTPWRLAIVFADNRALLARGMRGCSERKLLCYKRIDCVQT